MRIKKHEVCKEFEHRAWQMLGTEVDANIITADITDTTQSAYWCTPT